MLVCLAILGLEGWRDWTEYDKALDDAQVQTANLAHSLKQHAEDTFEMTDYALAAVTEMLQAGGTSREEMEHLHSILVNRVALLPRIREISVYGSEGQWLASSSQELFPDKSSQADSPYFAHHRNNLSRRPYFSPPDRSRPLGQRNTTISRRFTNSNGSFGGIVVATIDPSYFARFYAHFVIGRQGAIVLFAKDGTVISRFPFITQFTGSDPSKVSSIIEQMAPAPSGNNRFVSPLDGIDRITGYDSGDHFPFVVLASVSYDEAIADWRTEVVVRGAGIGLLAGAIGLLGWGLVTQLKRRESAEAKLAVLARTDGLTGLGNRRSFDERLAQEWRRSVREKSSLSLLLIDVDQFKQFNDVYGHQAGDDCLRAIARAVAGIARRPSDLAARYGGEEFVLLLPATAEKGAAQLAEELRSSVEALGLPHSRNEPKCVVTVSVGTATLNPPSGIPSERDNALVMLADHALYDAKRQGRNKVVIAARNAA
ncbi:sensor domain-containing diguanylate cyclase [Microvirga rosea]|uniref:sensor domain-containing diguanylate cyclase n=1 Tax=Microvirga rosea TaxID=2715425 RepID=UPI001D0B0D0A|nr:sensor domain-containing diguanylate cyclase [Microvirga rosea]MCB8820847.1 sensor domain-containing diguanylate cyclase [Microvirga rosea]